MATETVDEFRAVFAPPAVHEMIHVYLSCVHPWVTHLTHALAPVSGQPAKQVVHLLNEEDIPFSFSFRESSCHTDGYASSLSVEPTSGTVPPKSRYLTHAVGPFSRMFIIEDALKRKSD